MWLKQYINFNTNKRTNAENLFEKDFKTKNYGEYLQKSMTYEIGTEDVYGDFWNDKDKFDNSDYLENSPYFNIANKK